MVPVVVQVFLVDLRADKKMIKDAVFRLYDIQCKRINTLIRYKHDNGVVHAAFS